MFCKRKSLELYSEIEYFGRGLYMTKKQISSVIKKIDYTLDDNHLENLTEDIYNKIDAGLFDFSTYNFELFTQQNKKRKIYSYDKLSVENVLCHYLKNQIDRIFNVHYASRSKIMNRLFNTLPVIKNMNDFVIIRADFKSFFDSILAEHVYEKYIRQSLMSRGDKEILEDYIKKFKYCFAGLCLSNGLAEIICREFDNCIMARLEKYGVFFYERYVDDMLIMVNSFVSKDKFMEIIDEIIAEVFGRSPVKINMGIGKFSYISRRNLSPNNRFNFLGYDFNMKFATQKIYFEYGITEKKIRKYTNIIDKAFYEYSMTNDIEKFRQRLKLYSSRVVIARAIENSNFDWLTKGVVANYNELRYRMGELSEDTERFLRTLYFHLLKKYNCKRPYFLSNKADEDSIYNMYSSMSRNRTLVFEKNVGISQSILIKWIKKLDPTYLPLGKDYYRIVMDYLSLIKIE